MGTIVGLVIWLPIGLVADSMAGTVGVAEALWVVLAVLVVWFKAFLAFNCLTRVLI